MPSTPETIQLIAAAIFAVALLHTFAAKQFERLSHRYPRHAGLFHVPPIGRINFPMTRH